MGKRKIKLACISDLHLGTYGCQAKAINQYLKSIEPEVLVLNGDIIDIWQFSKNYWPDSHMKVLQRILRMASRGTRVVYLTGNHDELLRKFAGFKLGRIEIDNKLLLNLDGKTAWFFHGDVFDVTMKHSKWLAKLGAMGYDTLIHLNSAVNFMSRKIGKGPVSLSKKIKSGVKKAIQFMDDFEQTAIDLAIDKGYDYVVCGHIHQPQKRLATTAKGQTLYLNSGDWIENRSYLEYNQSNWTLGYFQPEEESKDLIENETEFEPFEPQKLLESILHA